MDISRRAIAKGLIAGTAAGLSGTVRIHALSQKEAQPDKYAEDQKLGWSQVMPGVWRARLGVPEKVTPVSTRQVTPLTAAFELLPHIESAPLDEIRGKVTQRGCLLELPLRPDEQVYGFGLQMLSFAQRGKKKIVRVNADPKFDTGDSHAPVPFYVTTEGVGVLVDTARYATFYIGDVQPKPEHALAQAATDEPDPNYIHNLQAHDKGVVTVEVPRAAGVDVYLFAGPGIGDAVRRYNLFSGGGPKLPEWGLGFWYRADARSTQQGALAMAKELRERKIPCDVFGLEPGWQTHAYSCTFEWNRNRFPDPYAFIRSAAEMNYRINLWEHAFTHPASPLFLTLKPRSADSGVWGGLVPDFEDPAARDAFGAHHAKTFIEQGVSGFKLDECDNSDFTGGWSFPECSCFPSGVDGEQMHMLFGLRYQMTLWNEFRKRSLDTFGLVRSSGALATPYPFVLYSDLYNHRDFIRALANSGFSGLLWCPEVRDAVSEEDLIRRLQSAVFSSLAMVNGWYIKSPPWRQLNRKLNNEDQPMENWERLEARCREIIGWRMQLIPYLRSAFARYREDGTPPFRALVMDFQHDEKLRTVDDQYMIGDRMMVAPLFAGEPARKVVLPAGRWHNFWTGETLLGGRILTVAATEEKIPVYVKDGSLVPWADVGLNVQDPAAHQLTVRVYGDGSLPWALGEENKSLQLSWSSGAGRATGTSEYKVCSWKRIG